MANSLLLEVCVDSPEGLTEALSGGADRIELCSALEIGGLTPSAGLIGFASNLRVNTPIYAMVRPRSGNFSYTENEIQTMEMDIDVIREAGLKGIVFGANDQFGTGRLDEKVLCRLMKRAQGLGSTLHRAFDLVPDLAEAIQVAVNVGFERILTSGRAPRAIPDGLSDLSRTVELASGRISIMPGSGITADNVDILTEAAPQIVEIHSSCSINQETKEESSKLLSFGFIGKTSRRRTKCSEVRRMKEAIYSLSMKKTF